MHQEHNIPWNQVASNLKFVRNNPHYTPRRTGIFTHNLPTQGRDFNHFVRVLAKTITAFAETERAKYQASFETPSAGLLFSDAMRDRYPEYLNTRNQRIETWVAAGARIKSVAATSYGGLADVVKILITEDEMLALLMLSRHPKIPLSQLHNLSWGHSFGFSRVAEYGLQLYLFVNIVVAMGMLENGEYLKLPKYGRMVSDLTSCVDYPAQRCIHQRFLDGFSKDVKTSLPEIHRDLPRLRDYLRSVFSLLYRYDLVLRESGIVPKWEEEIFVHLRQTLEGAKVRAIESEGGWITLFA